MTWMPPMSPASDSSRHAALTRLRWRVQGAAQGAAQERTAKDGATARTQCLRMPPVCGSTKGAQ
jgi:hypothetical protein